MRSTAPHAELPARDPGLPRFAWAAGLVAAGIAAGWLWAAAPAPSPEAEAALDAFAQTPIPAEVVLPGAGLFLREGCGACHATSDVSTALGPGLSGVGARAARRIAEAGYGGEADTATAYLREAIVDHCADAVPGYACVDLPDIGLRLTEDDVADLVDYLGRLTPEGSP